MTTPYARRSARVLLVDAAGRLLLLRLAFGDPHLPPPGNIWLTPGGGVDPGEELAVAAARELREETGLRADPGDLRLVAYCCGHVERGWVTGRVRDDFFLYRVPRHEMDTSGHTDFEKRHYTGHHWWTVAELAGTAETVYPRQLAGLLADLIAGRLPAQPVRLPFRDS